MILAEFGTTLDRIINTAGDTDLNARVLRAHLKIEVDGIGQTFHVFEYKKGDAV